MKLLKRYYERRSSENPLWLVVLSDIMTNLMLFFLIAYVFSIQPEKEAQANFIKGFDRERIEEQEKERKADEIMRKFREKDAAQTLSRELKDVSEIQMSEHQIRINISAPILFKSGKADLEQNAIEILNALGKVLSGMDNQVIVEGHTDNIPIKSGDYLTNWELSAARANSVADYLSQKFSIPHKRLVSAAYGEYKPIASNDTAEGRGKNRRIEILVIRK